MKTTNIKSNIIRKVWSSVESINQTTLLNLTDADLIKRIIQQVECVSGLTTEERQSLNDYLRVKVLLIRDISGSFR